MSIVKEGDLYKVIKINDITLEIRYGYYDIADRYSKYNEPIPIFPDLKKNPIYTQDGFMLVTKMQDRCKYFNGDMDSEGCYGCKFIAKEVDLVAICTNLNNKNNK